MYMYIYIYVCIYIYMYMYIYISPKNTIVELELCGPQLSYRPGAPPCTTLGFSSPRPPRRARSAQLQSLTPGAQVEMILLLHVGMCIHVYIYIYLFTLLYIYI